MSSSEILLKGWVHTKLGEVLLDVVGGGTPSRKVSSYFRGKIPWFTVKDMKSLRPNDAEEHISEVAVRDSATNLIPANTLIVATRISLGKAIRPTVACAINQDLKALIVGSGINSNFLLYWVEANERTIQELGSGTTVSGIRLETLNALKLHLPPSAEQTRIVEKLEELLSDLDAGVAELKTAQKKLAQYRQSLLKAAVEGALTAEWRKKNKAQETGAQLLDRILAERRQRWEEKQLAKFSGQGKTPPKGWQDKYPAPVPPDTTNLPELPKGWVWASLFQVGWLDRGKSKHRPRNAPFLFGGPYPFIQTGDIREADTYIRHASSSYSEVGLAQSRLWPKGTMCITIAANIGKTAILDIEACFPDSIVGFLSTSEHVSIDFIEYFMRSVQQKLEDEAPATAQKNINLKILERVCLPLPPVNEQVNIVKELRHLLDSASLQENAIQHSLKQSTAQRKNILKSAFSGQLVQQDPNDETARVLLERIRAEREERDKQPKIRKKITKKEGSGVEKKLIEVLAEAGDWVPAQEAFRRSGVADGATTEQIELLYAELRVLDKAKRLSVEPVTDAQGLKQYDRLKLIGKG